jgi:DNA-binding response OmpR family regulator
MPLSLLIIDDEPDIRFALNRYFQGLGSRVTLAQEMEEAEALLSHDHYDVVIVDLMLGGPQGKEGLEVIGFIRERCPNTRVILLTAFGSPEVEQEIRELKVDAYLAKPVPLADLAALICRISGQEYCGVGPA